jgi:uncharacterized protein YdhG (YjbR/CyaY superfamily)
MRKAHSRRRQVPSRDSAASITVAEYFAKVPPESRKVLRQLRAAILSSVSEDATETISYGIPAIKYNGIVVWYAAFAKHCSLFPTASVIEAFRKELRGYPTSKGTVKFPADKPLPTALIKKLVKARVAETRKKKTR